MRDADPRDGFTDRARFDIEEPDNPEPARHETGRARQGMPEMAHPGHDDGTLPIETELSLDLAEQIVDVIARAPRTVRAEMGQVLADLCSVHTGGIGELSGGDGGDTVPG